MYNKILDGNYPTLSQVYSQSTCLKRKVVCDLYDINNNLIARESNRCNPDNSICQRIGIQPNQISPKECTCNWTHAEIRALYALNESEKPIKAIIYNYPFPCDNCKEALKKAGVKHIICFDWANEFNNFKYSKHEYSL